MQRIPAINDSQESDHFYVYKWKNQKQREAERNAEIERRRQAIIDCYFDRESEKRDDSIHQKPVQGHAKEKARDSRSLDRTS